MSRAETMGRAAALVDEVIETLDERVSICACCGFKHYENWTERQAGQELRAMATKLRRWEHRLGRADLVPAG